MTGKYSIGDIIEHNNEPTIKRKILWVFSVLHDEYDYNLSKRIYYQTSILGAIDVQPTSLSEWVIDKYYSKCYDDVKIIGS